MNVIQGLGLFMMVDCAIGAHFQRYIRNDKRKCAIEYIGVVMGLLVFYIGAP